MKKKVCNTCKVAKPLEENFHKWAHGPDGHRASCKQCVCEAQRKRDEVKKWKRRFERSKEDMHQARRDRALEGF